jgi:peptidylprolyl isomerase
MKVLHAGRGTEHPKLDDCVKMSFKGWNRDGDVVASSRLEAEGAVQCLRQTLPGIVDALKTMTVGEERRVWIPAALTRGNDDERTSPNVDLTYDIALLELIKAPAVPKDLKPPRSATKTPSGLACLTLRKGSGTEHPSPDGKVSIHMSGWKADGSLLETTATQNLPVSYRLTELVSGLREALQRMVVGEKLRVWIPAELAYGKTPVRRGAPAGDVIYDLELLAIE